jgi:hypothetical protein
MEQIIMHPIGIIHSAYKESKDIPIQGTFNDKINRRRLEMTAKEKFTVSGSQLVDKVKQLVHEGNIRRVRVIHKGNTILEIPLSVGAPAAVVVALAAPVLAALGAFAALVTECTIEVEKIEKSD